MLVDAGIGDKNDAKFRDLFGMEEGRCALPEAIRRAGYELGDVTHVLPYATSTSTTAAGTPARTARRSLVPTFPSARYWLQRDELAYARHPSLRDRASFDPRNWEPLCRRRGGGALRRRRLADRGGDRGPRPRPHRRHVHRPGRRRRGRTGGVLGRSGADGRPRRLPLDHGLRPLPGDHPRAEAEVAAAGRRGGRLCVFDHEPDEPIRRIVETRPGRFRAEPAESAADGSSHG